MTKLRLKIKQVIQYQHIEKRSKSRQRVRRSSQKH